MSGKILGVSEIQSILPYRYPMLLVDRLHIESETHYVGLKNISVNEEFFNGHFPVQPIVPGVLQVEAMAQVAHCAVGAKLDPDGKNDIYIRRMKAVKFRRPNYPGDRMLIEVDVKEFHDDCAEVVALTRNNSGVTCQANLTIGVRPRTQPEGMPALYNDCDYSDKVALDISKIKNIIPHRYPFLLVDYIKSIEGQHVIAVKNTSFNEPLFRGYSKNGFVVVPESLQAEMVAQSGCAFTLSLPENKGKLGYFMSIQEAEFLHPIHAGDQIICELDIPEGKSRFGRGEGFLRVEDKVVCKITLTFAIVDPPSSSGPNGESK